MDGWKTRKVKLAERRLEKKEGSDDLRLGHMTKMKE
jgi:hypothetical protein